MVWYLLSSFCVDDRFDGDSSFCYAVMLPIIVARQFYMDGIYNFLPFVEHSISYFVYNSLDGNVPFEIQLLHVLHV